MTVNSLVDKRNIAVLALASVSALASACKGDHHPPPPPPGPSTRPGPERAARWVTGCASSPEGGARPAAPPALDSAENQATTIEVHRDIEVTVDANPNETQDWAYWLGAPQAVGALNGGSGTSCATFYAIQNPSATLRSVGNHCFKALGVPVNLPVAMSADTPVRAALEAIIARLDSGVSKIAILAFDGVVDERERSEGLAAVEEFTTLFSTQIDRHRGLFIVSAPHCFRYLFVLTTADAVAAGRLTALQLKEQLARALAEQKDCPSAHAPNAWVSAVEVGPGWTPTVRSVGGCHPGKDASPATIRCDISDSFDTGEASLVFALDARPTRLPSQLWDLSGASAAEFELEANVPAIQLDDADRQYRLVPGRASSASDLVISSDVERCSEAIDALCLGQWCPSPHAKLCSSRSREIRSVLRVGKSGGLPDGQLGFLLIRSNVALPTSTELQDYKPAARQAAAWRNVLPQATLSRGALQVSPCLESLVAEAAKQFDPTATRFDVPAQCSADSELGKIANALALADGRAFPYRSHGVGQALTYRAGMFPLLSILRAAVRRRNRPEPVTRLEVGFTCGLTGNAGGD